MPLRSRVARLALLALSAGALPAAEPRPLLSPIFGDHMVLQRDKPNPLWGWTQPGAEVAVHFSGQNKTTAADADGRWRVVLDPLPLSVEPDVVTVTAKNRQSEIESRKLQDVLVGDVWLCGGQSNMQFGLPGVKDGAREVAAADHPRIRLFTVATRVAYAPVTAPQGAWKVCSPQTVAEDGGFSAIAYFFACRVQAATGVPIGLIQDCLGGSPVESWMSPATLHTLPDFARPMAELARLRDRPGPPYGSYLMHWLDEFDAGLREQTWFTPALDDHDWKSVPLPGGFAELGVADVPAVVWFRREIMLPDPLPAGAATLHLGVVEKMDTAWVNGRWVGASSWVENPRAYRLAPGVLRPGRNQITVRVFKLKSQTGFLSAPEKIRLAFAGGPDVPLAGDWRAALSVDARPPHPLPLGYENYPIMPSVLYEGMIAPVAPLALTGALWYQGEANASRAHQYRTLLPALIADWRRVFGQGEFPFLIVQLPAFQARKAQPGTDDWAELREAQALTARTVPSCGLAVTIDTGDATDIHPRDKRPVGERLALVALAQHYGKNVAASGPVFRAAERDGPALRLRFDHADGGLKSSAEKLAEFSVAGSDRQWHWADARIDGDTVIVSSPEVPAPVAVRYAWQANPRATLVNGAGLPAAPFRSDDWPGVTAGRAPW
jgi:sialate O-acetylesterase